MLYMLNEKGAIGDVLKDAIYTNSARIMELNKGMLIQLFRELYKL